MTEEETTKPKRPYNKRGVEQAASQAFAARYAELQKKEPKPEREQFTTNGKSYVSTDGLTRNEIYKLLYAKTKGKYEVEHIFRSWERSKSTRRRSS